MTDEELASAERKTAGKPDSSVRLRVEFERRLIEEGPIIHEFELLYENPSRWRINRSEPATGKFVDTGYSNGQMWQNTDSGANLSEKQTAPPGYEPETRIADFTTVIRRFCLGPFAHSLQFTFQAEAESGDGGAWTGRVYWKNDRIWKLRGVVAGDNLVVQDNRIEDSEGALLALGRYFDYQQDDILGHSVYHRIEYWISDEELGRVWELISVEPLDPKDLDAVLDPPKAGQAEPMRGRIVPMLVDYRGGEPVVRVVDEQGGIEVRKTNESDPRAVSRAAWRIIAWVSALLVLVAMLMIWRSRRPGLGV